MDIFLSSNDVIIRAVAASTHVIYKPSHATV